MTKFEIEGITLAVFKIEQMLEFYANVFGIEFTAQEMFGATLYTGNFDYLKLLFCPAEIARNEARQNRHQFDIIVFDLEKMLSKVVEFGGEIIGDVLEDENFKRVGIYDPDRNSMVLKEWKQND